MDYDFDITDSYGMVWCYDGYKMVLLMVLKISCIRARGRLGKMGVTDVAIPLINCDRESNLKFHGWILYIDERG